MKKSEKFDFFIDNIQPQRYDINLKRQIFQLKNHLPALTCWDTLITIKYEINLC